MSDIDIERLLQSGRDIEAECRALAANPPYDVSRLPRYNTAEFWAGMRTKTINALDEKIIYGRYLVKQERSLTTCHRYRFDTTPLYPMPDTRGYTPEISERVDLDQNLNSAERDTLRFIIRTAFRQARHSRRLNVTVSFIARGRVRCTRAIQNHLRQLERAGYIAASVVINAATKMTECLEIVLLEAVFPEHHQVRWPEKLENSGVHFSSHKENPLIYIRERVHDWAMRCMNGVFRSYMKRKPLLDQAGFA